MPQSISLMVVHVVFTTEEQYPFIDDSIRGPLHNYMAGICREKKCYPYRIGGTDNHVHIISTLARTVSISDLVGDIKRASSTWMKEQGDKYRKFYWQQGYGAFGVGHERLDDVVAYVEGQPQHHKDVSFREEYRSFLDERDIDYDERYVWE